MKYFVALNKCPHGTMSLSLDDDCSSTSTRFTKDKCCGRWEVAHEFNLDYNDIEELIIMLENAKEDLDRMEY